MTITVPAEQADGLADDHQREHAGVKRDIDHVQWGQEVFSPDCEEQKYSQDNEPYQFKSNMTKAICEIVQIGCQTGRAEECIDARSCIGYHELNSTQSCKPKAIDK